MASQTPLGWVPALVLVIAANFQAVFLIMAGYYGFQALDRALPLPFSWANLLLPLTLVLAGYNYWLVIKRLLRKSQP